MPNKVALVTGASYGIGKAIAEHLTFRGFRVYGTTRNIISDTQAESKNVFEWLTLNVHSDVSVKACVTELLQRTGRIDVLINNAGSALAGPLEEVPIEKAQEQFNTNFFGAVRMIQAVLPSMRQQQSGQIINIGSLAGATCSPGMGMYAASKFALSGYTETLRAEVKSFNIQVSLIMPCMIKDWSIKRAHQPHPGLSDYDSFRNTVLPRIEEAAQDGIAPEVVAKCVARVTEATSPALYYSVGKNALLTLIMKTLLPQRIFENVIHRFFNIPNQSPAPETKPIKNLHKTATVR